MLRVSPTCVKKLQRACEYGRAAMHLARSSMPASPVVSPLATPGFFDATPGQHELMK